MTHTGKDSLTLRKQCSYENIKHLGLVKQEAAHICHQNSDDFYKQQHLMLDNAGNIRQSLNVIGQLKGGKNCA